MPHPLDLSFPCLSASTWAFSHRIAAVTSVPQPDQRPWCPLRAKAECGDLRVHVRILLSPRLPGSRDPFGDSAELASRRQLALLTRAVRLGPDRTGSARRAGGRRRRAVLGPDLAAAAPVLGAGRGRGLKWNREADVRGVAGRTCGNPRVGRARGGLEARRGCGEAQAARAAGPKIWGQTHVCLGT